MGFNLVIVTALLSLGYVDGRSSRAYPLGCSNRHPTYYTYDERDSIDDIDYVVPTTEDKFNDTNRRLNKKHIDYRKLPKESSEMVHAYKRYEVVRKLGCGKFSDVYEAMDVSQSVAADVYTSKKSSTKDEKEKTTK